MALWPAALEPWLQGSQRRVSRIPPLAPGCGEDQALGLSPPTIQGLEEGARLLPSVVRQQLPRVRLSVAGGVGELQWYIDGQWHYSSKANQSIHHRFERLGPHEIVVVDEQGHTDRRRISVEPLEKG